MAYRQGKRDVRDRGDRRDKRKAGKKRTSIRYFDYNLLFILIFLLCFGLVMLYSSSSYTAANTYGDSAYFLKRQIRNMLVGLVPMIILAVIDYRKWKKFGRMIYLISFTMCILVLIPGVGVNHNGSSRWLGFGSLSFQPSELAKISVILFLAALLERMTKMISTGWGLFKVFLVLLPLVGVVAYQNLSTAIIIFAIAVCMIFVASSKYMHFVVVGVAGVLLGVFFIAAAGYRVGRITAWLHPEEASSDDVYQTMQGLYAIGSGKLFGKGLGESIQKMGNVPENENDMIFSIICEELGLFGAVCVILLYILLLWRMMVIANNAADLYGALLVSGIMSHIAIQVILNIAVVTNSMPNTGVTLPFISYGGTSIVFLMAEMGLALSVSKGIRLTSIE